MYSIFDSIYQVDLDRIAISLFLEVNYHDQSTTSRDQIATLALLPEACCWHVSMTTCSLPLHGLNRPTAIKMSISKVTFLIFLTYRGLHCNTFQGSISHTFVSLCSCEKRVLRPS